MHLQKLKDLQMVASKVQTKLNKVHEKIKIILIFFGD
jgi:hypothetical protein